MGKMDELLAEVADLVTLEQRTREDKHRIGTIFVALNEDHDLSGPWISKKLGMKLNLVYYFMRRVKKKEGFADDVDERGSLQSSEADVELSASQGKGSAGRGRRAKDHVEEATSKTMKAVVEDSGKEAALRSTMKLELGGRLLTDFSAEFNDLGLDGFYDLLRDSMEQYIEGPGRHETRIRELSAVAIDLRGEIDTRNDMIHILQNEVESAETENKDLAQKVEIATQFLTAVHLMGTGENLQSAMRISGLTGGQRT